MFCFLGLAVLLISLALVVLLAPVGTTPSPVSTVTPAPVSPVSPGSTRPRCPGHRRQMKAILPSFRPHKRLSSNIDVAFVHKKGTARSIWGSSGCVLGFLSDGTNDPLRKNDIAIA